MYKNKIRFLTFPLLAFFTGLLLLAFSAPQDKKVGGPWEIPAEYKEMKNTFADDATLLRKGKMHYIKHCRICHGNVGEGNGPKAPSLETGMRSLSSEEFQAQSDGVIYYQSFIGRDEMPNYEETFPEEEDRWAVVNYMRSLKK